MSFSINLDRDRDLKARTFKPSASLSKTMTVFGLLFLAFCIFDYSPYGTGLVASGLADAQRWFQGEIGSLRIRM